MSRLFESFGDDADEAEFPVVSLPEAEAADDTVGAEGKTALLAGVDLDDALASGDPLDEGASGSRADSASYEPLSDDYDIPDFDADARDISAYEDAKRRHLRQQISSAETGIHASFKQKREQLQREVKNARSFEEERRASAMFTTRQYANAYPNHVDKKGITPASFFENLFSFGRAGRLYRAASVATEALEQLRTAMRKREEQLGALESQMGRAIYLKEESIKKAMETEAGLAEFNDRPEINPLHRRTQRITKERAAYARRLERNEVADDEQRDRAMAEHKLKYAELPLMGAIIAKVARYGTLSYFQLRDLAKKESLLTYDPRLDPLRNSVFDVYSVASAVAAKLKRNDNGTAFRVADHFKACWRNQEQAEELYGAHRSALREDRGLPKMEPRDPSEAEVLDRLAALAAQVDGGGVRDHLPPAINGTSTLRG